jgi:hypothetical protein
MKIKAYWKPIIRNPFIPDINRIPRGCTKTVEVPDDMDLKEVENFAKADTQEGYVFDKIEVMPDDAKLSPLIENHD